MGIPTFDIVRCTAGTVHYPPGGKYGPHRYKDIQLFLLHAGSVRVSIDGSEQLLLPGYAMLFLPGQTIALAFDPQQVSWHRWITFLPCGEAAAVLDMLAALPVAAPISGQMNRLVDLAVRQHGHSEPAHRDVLHTLARAALELYAADCRGVGDVGSHPVVLKVKNFLFDRYAEPLTLRDLADHAHVSASHLVRLFRQYEQISPIQYLWQYRLERGLDLLTTSGLSVGEIAGHCGFKTSYHFARSIKRYTKRTPTEIRRGGPLISSPYS